MSDQAPSSPSLGELYLNQVQNGGSPTAAPSQDDSAPNPATGQVPSAQAPQAAPAVSPNPAPSPDQSAAIAETTKHAAIGKFFSNLVNSGSGSSASQLWRTVIGSAIVGMGAGGSDPVVARGPNGDIRDRSIAGAASRGFAAGGNYAQEQQDRAAQRAQTARTAARLDQQAKIEMDDLALRKAADARAQVNSIQNAQEHTLRMKALQQNLDAGNWDQAQRAADVAQKQTAFFNDLQDVGATPLAGQDGQPMQFNSLLDAEKAAHDNPNFFIGNYKTRVAYNPGASKYEIHKVPDSDVKNVTLTDSTGKTHTIPRMSTSEYLDFQARQQNLRKNTLSTEETATNLNRLQLQMHDEDNYGQALNGDLDFSKLSNRDRAALYGRASKDAQNAMRSRSAAEAHLAKLNQNLAGTDPDELKDAKEQLQEATELSRTYGSVLSRLHGNPTPNPNQVSPNVQKAIGAIGHLPKEQQQAQIDSSSLSPEEKQAAKKALGLK